MVVLQLGETGESVFLERLTLLGLLARQAMGADHPEPAIGDGEPLDVHLRIAAGKVEGAAELDPAVLAEAVA
jgi:hypothetical protein